MLPYLKIIFSLLLLNIVCFYSNSQEFKKELIPISFFTSNESYKVGAKCVGKKITYLNESVNVEDGTVSDSSLIKIVTNNF